MNNSIIKKFREILAEQGKECTIEQAEKIYKSAERVIKKSKKLSQIDLWKMQKIKVKGMTEEEKNQAISLYQYVRDIG